MRSAVLALVVLALAPAAGVAATPFTPAVPLAPPDSGFGGAAVNARGDMAVVWQGSRELGADPAAGKVELLRAPAGAGFAPVERLASGRVREPRLALGADGALTALWWAGDLVSVGYASGTVGAGLGAPGAFPGTSAPYTFVGPRGEMMNVGTNRTADRDLPTQVIGAYRPPGGEFGPRRVLAEHGYVDERTTASVHPGGGATVVYRAATGSRDPLRVWALTVSPAGEPSAPVPLSSASEDARMGPPDVEAGPGGELAVGWRMSTPSSGPIPFPIAGPPRVAVRTAGGVWGVPEGLPEEGVSGNPVDLSFDHRGNLVAVWPGVAPLGNPRAPGVLRVAVRPPGGPFGPTEEISAPRAFPPYAGALDGGGNLVVTWTEAQEGTGAAPVLLAAARRPGGRLGLPATLHARAMPRALLLDGGEGGLLVAQEFPSQAIVGYRYVRALLDVPAAPPLGRLAVDGRLRRARFVVTEPGKVVAAIDRAIPRRGYARVSQRIARFGRGVRRLALAGARGRRLAPGTYRLTLAAHDLTGRRLARRQVRFGVPRP